MSENIKTPIYILAGDRAQANLYFENADVRFVSDVYKIKGLKRGLVLICTGTWRDREDAYEIVREARLRGFSIVNVP